MSAKRVKPSKFRQVWILDKEWLTLSDISSLLKEGEVFKISQDEYGDFLVTILPAPEQEIN